jgi:hypothetical protein
MNGGRSAPGGFFANADFDYEARIVLGAAAGGIGDVGLVLATLDRIADGDPQSWFDATFKKINRVLSTGWGLAIFAVGVSRVAAAAINGHTTRRLPEILLGLVVPLGICLYMLKFSKSYPERVTHHETSSSVGHASR